MALYKKVYVHIQYLTGGEKADKPAFNLQVGRTHCHSIYLLPK